VALTKRGHPFQLLFHRGDTHFELKCAILVLKKLNGDSSETFPIQQGAPELLTAIFPDLAGQVHNAIGLLM
jgi:hypothetical protein